MTVKILKLLKNLRTKHTKQSYVNIINWSSREHKSYIRVLFKYNFY